MSNLLKVWTPDDVQNSQDQAKAFCEYAQQVAGIAWPTGADIAIVRKKAKTFFEHYPHTDWRTLCRVVQWCKARRRRPPRIWMVLDKFRDAHTAGFLPELDSQEQIEQHIECGIADALASETREGWRRRLIMARGPQQKRSVLSEWQSSSQALSNSR